MRGGRTRSAPLNPAQSGVYTPTITNGTNVAASTPLRAKWSRNNDIVTVAGRLQCDPTAGAGAVTDLELSLPIPSVFVDFDDASGCGSGENLAEPVGIQSNAATGRVKMVFAAQTTANHSIYYMYQYQVLP